jgi:hypothetical protein
MMFVTTACLGGSQDDMTDSSAAAVQVAPGLAIDVRPRTAARRFSFGKTDPPVVASGSAR